MGLVMLRHTTPDVSPGTCYGRTDLALADSFEAEAEAVTCRIEGADHIITSPLQRCYRLAVYLANLWDIPVSADDRLQEMDFGTWENRAWADIPRADLDAWAADFLHARPHGGESVAMLRARCLDALDDHIATSGSTLLVTHSGVIKAVCAKGNLPDDFDTSVAYGHHICWPKQEKRT